VITRRTIFLLRKARDRAHILEGFVRALDLLDEIIAHIRASRNPAEAKAGLISKWEFSPIQAQAILDMRLQKLTGMERESVQEEYNKIMEEIKGLELILNDFSILKQVIIDETNKFRDRYADERKCRIIEKSISFSIEDLIADENVAVTCSHRGYIKRTPVNIYKEQRRGGKGRLGMRTHDDDFVENLFIASTHDYLMIFTNFGKVYWIKVHQIPQADAATKGKAIVNLIQLEEGEKPVAFHAVREFSEDINLVFATKKGMIKKTSLAAYKNIRTNGIIAIGIRENDELITVRQTNGQKSILLATKLGKSIRFDENDIRNIGRTAMGVVGIRIAEVDEVVEMAVVGTESEGSLLTISQNGYGKRTLIEEYRSQNRGGSGMLNMRMTEKTGFIAGVRYVYDGLSVLIISQHGKLIRVDPSQIRNIGRVTQGVRMIHLDDPEDRVVGIGLIPIDEVDEEMEETTELETSLSTEDSQDVSSEETSSDLYKDQEDEDLESSDETI